MRSRAQTWRWLTCATLLVAIAAVLALIVVGMGGLHGGRDADADATLVAGALATQAALGRAIEGTLTWAAEWGATDAARATAAAGAATAAALTRTPAPRAASSATPPDEADAFAQQRTALAATRAQLILGVEQTHAARALLTPTEAPAATSPPPTLTPSATLPVVITLTPTPEPGLARIRPPWRPFYMRALDRLRAAADEARAG